MFTVLNFIYFCFFHLLSMHCFIKKNSLLKKFEVTDAYFLMFLILLLGIIKKIFENTKIFQILKLICI